MVITMHNDDFIVNKLKIIVDSISDGVLAVDNKMRITFFNKAAAIILGHSRENALGQKCWDVFTTDACQNNCPLQQTFKSGKPTINKYVCSIRKDGRRIPISISTALLKDDQDNIIGGVETFRDLSQVETLRKQLEGSYTYSDMIGSSKPMQELFELLPIIAQSNATVLIEGESGTGKELVAKAIHHLSNRNTNPLIVVNCAAIPDALLESELFGYKAGAFTDAKKDKKGRFALADKGTIFLDEIGDVSPAIQVKLLRVLQEFTYEPLGSTQTEKTDVRVITATNRNLVELMNSDRFREDLYYRLNVISIKIPPLRDRLSDIPMLIEHFIGKFSHLQNKDISGITPLALNILMNHKYPGNVRELENIIEHAFVLCPGGVIHPEHLPNHIQNVRPVPVIEVAETLEEMEALFLTAALKRNNWNRKDTAKELGVNPSTLYRKMIKLHIEPPKPSGKKPKNA